MVMDHAPTWSGRSLQQVELVVDEGLTVMDCLHVNVFLLHGVELQHRTDHSTSIHQTKAENLGWSTFYPLVFYVSVRIKFHFVLLPS